MSLLAVDDLEARHGLLQAVRGISFAVDAGETVALVGANGAGKTTLLRTIAGAHPASAGTVSLDGVDVTHLAAHRRVAQGLALVPEGRRLFQEMTVEENLLVAGRRARPGDWNVDRVLEAFPMLKPLRGKRACELSGGQQQAASIGRALMTNPRLLLIDEVSWGLAPIAVDAVYESVATLLAGAIRYCTLLDSSSCLRPWTCPAAAGQSAPARRHRRSPPRRPERVSRPVVGVDVDVGVRGGRVHLYVGHCSRFGRCVRLSDEPLSSTMPSARWHPTTRARSRRSRGRRGPLARPCSRQARVRGVRGDGRGRDGADRGRPATATFSDRSRDPPPGRHRLQVAGAGVVVSRRPIGPAPAILQAVRTRLPRERCPVEEDVVGGERMGRKTRPSIKRS